MFLYMQPSDRSLPDTDFPIGTHVTRSIYCHRVYPEHLWCGHCVLDGIVRIVQVFCDQKRMIVLIVPQWSVLRGWRRFCHSLEIPYRVPDHPPHLAICRCVVLPGIPSLAGQGGPGGRSSIHLGSPSWQRGRGSSSGRFRVPGYPEYCGVGEVNLPQPFLPGHAVWLQVGQAASWSPGAARDLAADHAGMGRYCWCYNL